MEKKLKYTFVLQVELDESFLDDVCVTAAEGGINYWANGRSHTLKGSQFRIVEQEPSEGDTAKVFDVTHEAIKLGITRVLNPAFEINADTRMDLYRAVVTNDCGHIDADVADAIVQAAMFNELVYG